MTWRKADPRIACTVGPRLHPGRLQHRAAIGEPRNQGLGGGTTGHIIKGTVLISCLARTWALCRWICLGRCRDTGSTVQRSHRCNSSSSRIWGWHYLWESLEPQDLMAFYCCSMCVRQLNTHETNMCIKCAPTCYILRIHSTVFINLTFRSWFAELFNMTFYWFFHRFFNPHYLLIILLWTIFKIIIRSAQSFRNSDIRCFKTGFISCFAIALRWSHEALHLLSIWHKLSWSWSKSTWK